MRVFVGLAVALGVVVVGCAADTSGGDAPAPVDVGVHPQGGSQAALPVVDIAGTAKFTSIGSATPTPGARTIPFYTFTQTDPTNGATYAMSFVGSDPASGTTSTIPVQIIPIKLTFANGAVIDGAARAGAVASSPIFASQAYPGQMAGGDVGQYGDVFMRAQANRIGSSYHVKFGAPTTLKTVSIAVPANQGTAARTSRGAVYGLADITWFSSQLQNLIGQLHIDPTVMPIFLTDNVMLYEGNDPANCCVIGYHGASKVSGNGGGSTNSSGNAQINTYIYAAYTEPGTFGASGLQDIHALSHEVAEWLDDPFTNNIINPWLTPTAPQYGCTAWLETGDPVVGIWFPLAGNPDPNPLAGGVWHPEDEVFRSWFLRESPSSAYGGHYTFMGTDNPFPGFHTVATGCN